MTCFLSKRRLTLRSLKGLEAVQVMNLYLTVAYVFTFLGALIGRPSDRIDYQWSWTIQCVWRWRVILRRELPSLYPQLHH